MSPLPIPSLCSAFYVGRQRDTACTCRRATAVQRSTDTLGLQQQTRRSGVRRMNDGTDGQTDGRELNSFTVLRTMWSRVDNQNLNPVHTTRPNSDKTVMSRHNGVQSNTSMLHFFLRVMVSESRETVSGSGISWATCK